jgi:hypothetical protein
MHLEERAAMGLHGSILDRRGTVGAGKFAPVNALLKRIAVIALLMGGATIAAGEPRIGHFTQYDAGEFIIVTSRSGAQARHIVEDLGKFRRTLERTLGKNATHNSFPTYLVIASTADWKNWLQPRQDIAGYFHRARFANFMALNGDWPPEQTLHVVFHEYTHYYLASQFAGEYPPWYNEGLAELMGYAMFDKGRAILRIPLDQVYEARDSDWIPFERLIRIDQTDPEYQSHKLAPSFYAQSWLALHYGMVENRDFGRQIQGYINDLNRLVPQDQAVRSNFGDLAAADKLLRDYSHQSKLMSGALDLGDIPPVTLPEGKSLDDTDSMAILADLMLEIRVAPDRVRPLVESLGRLDRNPARAAIFAARLAQLEDDNAAFDAAVTKAESSLAADDWQQRRELAVVLLNSGLETSPMSSRKDADAQRDLQRSLKWFAEAINHNNQDVEALWGFGAAATRLDRNLDLAEQALVAAYHRAPASGDIAVSLADLKGRQDKPEEMIPFLHDAIRNATDLGMKRWATDALQRTEENIAERKRVDAENRKNREAYEKQLAEYEKKYGKVKKK